MINILKLLKRYKVIGEDEEDFGGLHEAMKWTLLSSRMMGLLPLVGIMKPDSNGLRFTLRTPYAIIYAISICGQVLMFLMNLHWLYQNGMSLTNFTNTLFYSSSMISSLIFANIGRIWPKLITRVEAIECQLPPFKRNVAASCNVTVIFILFSAFVEHMLSVTYGYTVAKSCNTDNVIEAFFRYNMPWIFNITPFAYWKALLSEIFNFQSTFMWSYNDLMIMVLSIYLTEHFIVHNHLLKVAVKQEYFPCEEFRIQYLKIVNLVKLINSQIDIYILTSFGFNLYWICMQLFYSLNKSNTGHYVGCEINDRITINGAFDPFYGVEHTVYFTYSFSFLVVRTLLVLLLAARVHTHAVVPLTMLYEVPSSKYNIEVERFIAQINSIKIALSGLDFFYVTRTMILTLLGTMVTYELVLLQFNTSK